MLTIDEISLSRGTKWYKLPEKGLVQIRAPVSTGKEHYLLRRLTMRMNRSTAYGLLAIGYVAQHKDEGLAVSQTIAKAYNIPFEYLLNTTTPL